MEAAIENLTTSEAAIAAGVTVAKINRMIDKRILPKMLYKASQNRTVRKDACLWIAFYFETEDVLTSVARVKAMRNALAHNHSWTELRQCKFEESRTVQVLLSSIWDDVDRRLSQLREAQELIIEDPEILRGTPVIRGTRIPVYARCQSGRCGRRLRNCARFTPSSRHRRSNWLRCTRKQTRNGGAHGAGTCPRACRSQFPRSDFVAPH